MADLSDFRALFPEFETVIDATIDFYLLRSDEFLSGIDNTHKNANWGECYDDAVCYISAHELALSQNRQNTTKVDPTSGFTVTGSRAGAITSASDGQLSASFSSPASLVDGSSVSAYYGLTEYGQRYLALKQQCLAQAKLSKCQ